MSSSPASTTRTSTPLMESPTAEPERVREDIAEFLANVIAVTPGEKPEETAYGRAIVDMLRDYGNPDINEMTLENANLTYRRKFKPSDQQKLMVKKWREKFGNRGMVRFGKDKYYDHEDDTFYKIIPRANYTKREERKTEGRRMINKESLNVRKGSVDNLLAELAHHVQYMDLAQKEREYQSQELLSERRKYGDSSPRSRGVYGVPGTVEYEAHEEIEPQLKDELKRRLDTYLFGDKSAMNVEDLFKF